MCTVVSRMVMRCPAMVTERLAGCQGHYVDSPHAAVEPRVNRAHAGDALPDAQTHLPGGQRSTGPRDAMCPVVCEIRAGIGTLTRKAMRAAVPAVISAGTRTYGRRQVPSGRRGACPSARREFRHWLPNVVGMRGVRLGGGHWLTNLAGVEACVRRVWFHRLRNAAVVGGTGWRHGLRNVAVVQGWRTGWPTGCRT